MTSIESEIIARLQTLLPKKRIEHTLRVQETAKKLARKWNLDVNKASLAALLHDSAKAADDAAFKAQNITIDPFLRDIHDNYFPIFHALAGPLWVKAQFQIDDEEILSAIKWHTTGKKEMSPLDQIIFIADFTEPERDFPIRSHAEALADKNLDHATACVSYACIHHLLQKPAKVHPLSFECYNTYLGTLDPSEKKKIADFYK